MLFSMRYRDFDNIFLFADLLVFWSTYARPFDSKRSNSVCYCGDQPLPACLASNFAIHWAKSLLGIWKANWSFIRFLCSTSLPQICTRWVRSTIKLFANSTLWAVPLLINLNNFSPWIIRECRESNPEQLGEKRECYLCAKPSPLQSFLHLPAPFHRHLLRHGPGAAQERSVQRRHLHRSEDPLPTGASHQRLVRVHQGGPHRVLAHRGSLILAGWGLLYLWLFTHLAHALRLPVDFLNSTWRR